MNLDISLIPFGHLGHVIPGLLPYLKKSEDWTHGRAKVDDILKFLVNGQMYLWLVFDKDDNTIYGHVITEVKEYPQLKVLVIQYCSGEAHHMKHVEDKMYNILDQFAKDADCAGIELYGRPGWGPHVRKYGYTTEMVVFSKFFEGDVS